MYLKHILLGKTVVKCADSAVTTMVQFYLKFYTRFMDVGYRAVYK